MPEYITYFKERAFSRLFCLFKEKYASLGRFSGKVKLTNLTEKESKAFTDFFGKTFLPKETIVISFKQFEQVMKQSIYQDFSWKELLENYFEEPLVTKKEQKRQEKENEFYYFEELIHSLEPSDGRKWLEQTHLCKNDTYQLLHKRYREDADLLRNDLIHIVQLINHLPYLKNETMSLALFSGKITKNPHFLDMGRRNNHLFLKALSDIKKVPNPKEHTDKLSLLLDVGIYPDALSNTVITYGLQGHEFLTICLSLNQPCILCLENLAFIKKIDSPEKKVFVFENPSILSDIIAQKLKCSVVITSGIPNLAVYKVLDRLVQHHNQLYYNGDFDPEGLIIAEKLKERYQSQLTLFKYEEKDYEYCKSGEEITESRMKKLNLIHSKELEIIKSKLLDTKCSGFQEKNISNIMKEMIQIKDCINDDQLS